MAITIAPVLKTIGSFDATKSHDISFSIEGMNIIPYYVNVTIKDNNTNTIVYTHSTVVNLSTLIHTIPANELQNNKYYKCYITITSTEYETSPMSNTVTFYCIPTPTFEFINIPSSINISALSALLRYEQAGIIYDPLKSYVVKVFNSQNNEVFNSSTIYVQQNPNLLVKIEGLLEDAYTIRGYGETANGILLTTEETFDVRYNSPSSFSSMFLDNLYDKGQIKLTSNIIGLMGEIFGEEIYIDDTMIDLRDAYVIFNKGFLIQEDFYIIAIMKNVMLNTRKPFMTLSNGKGKVELFWRKNAFKSNWGYEQAFVEVRVTDGKMVYTNHSNYLDPPTLEDKMTVGLKRKGNKYQCVIQTSTWDLVVG